MIDLHTHILPGLDDGAGTIEESLEMARVAAADGVEIIAATPHADSYWMQNMPQAPKRLRELSEALAKCGVKVRLVEGCEALIDLDLAARVVAGQIPTLNGSRYILIEWPLQNHPIYAEQVAFDLRLKGYVPLLGHAERYRVVQEDVNVVTGFVNKGGLVQVTACSLVGTFGSSAKRTAEILLEHNLAHVMVSDAHSVSHRPPVLSRGRDRAAQVVGPEMARALVYDTPLAIVENREVNAPEPRPYKPRPFWAIWR